MSDRDILLLGAFLVALLGGLFCLWPRWMKGVMFRCSPQLDQHHALWFHYLLGIWPLLQSVFILILPPSSGRSIVLVITCICIVVQYLIIVRDRLLLERLYF